MQNIRGIHNLGSPIHFLSQIEKVTTGTVQFLFHNFFRITRNEYNSVIGGRFYSRRIFEIGGKDAWEFFRHEQWIQLGLFVRKVYIDYLPMCAGDYQSGVSQES